MTHETIDLGTPIKCRECGFEDSVRLFKGTKIKDLLCGGCRKQGTMMRNTFYDQVMRRKAKEVKEKKP